MSTYWFELELAGPIDLEDASERLYPRASDGNLAGDEQGGSIMFAREARNAIEAILSAIDDVETAGLTVTSVADDLVTAEEIAERTQRSGAAVGHWITGSRAGGDFPRPVVVRSVRVRLYSWAEVAEWLADRGLGKVDRMVAETASAAMQVSALLRARQVLRAAPEARKEQLAKLLANSCS